MAEVFDEDRPVHRTVDGERRLDGILPQCGNEGHGFPMTPRNAAITLRPHFARPYNRAILVTFRSRR